MIKCEIVGVARVTRMLAAATGALLFSMSGASVAADNATAVERGKYIATAGNCATCHTAEGGEPFAGGLAFATPFGTMYSTNITQDAETGIGKWSQEEFANAVRKGVRPNGEHLY